jgi:hypothetical protein
MKKFAMLLMALSVSLVTLGCQPSTPAKKTEPAKTEAAAPKADDKKVEEKKADEKPAAPAAEEKK